jgi:hypothetical protein
MYSQYTYKQYVMQAYTNGTYTYTWWYACVLRLACHNLRILFQPSSSRIASIIKIAGIGGFIRRRKKRIKFIGIEDRHGASWHEVRLPQQHAGWLIKIKSYHIERHEDRTHTNLKSPKQQPTLFLLYGINPYMTHHLLSAVDHRPNMSSRSHSQPPARGSPHIV